MGAVHNIAEGDDGWGGLAGAHLLGSQKFSRELYGLGRFLNELLYNDHAACGSATLIIRMARQLCSNYIMPGINSEYRAQEKANRVYTCLDFSVDKNRVGSMLRKLRIIYAPKLHTDSDRPTTNGVCATPLEKLLTAEIKPFTIRSFSRLLFRWPCQTGIWLQARPADGPAS